MKAFLLALVTYRPQRLNAVVILPRSEEEHEALLSTLDDLVAECLNPAPSLGALNEERDLGPGSAQGGPRGKSSLPSGVKVDPQGRAEAERRGAKLPDAFWRGLPAMDPSGPRLDGGANAWEDLSAIELRLYTAHARSLGPYCSQRWLEHVQTTNVGNDAEYAHGRGSLVRFLRAQYRTNDVPADGRPFTNEHKTHYDAYQ